MNSHGIRTRALRIVVLVSLLVLVTPVPAYPVRTAGIDPVDYYVDAVNGDDADAGTFEEPFEKISYALSVSDGDDTIYVFPGTYDTANGESFPLAVYGQSLMSIYGPDLTIIESDGANGAILAQMLDDGDRISGFTITGGGVDAGAGINVYLSMSNEAGWPLIENNVLVGNDSDFSGGGLSLYTGTPQAVAPCIRNNTFVGNSANGGGAIRISGSVGATIEDNVFDGNSAEFGGAVHFTSVDATLTITGNRFVDNATSSNGGAIYMSPAGSEMHSIVGNTFMENSASGDGGALWLYGANVDIFGNNAGGNDAGGSGDGGFAWHQHCVIHAENNVIGGHSAGGEGAAWYLDESVLYERNDTVVDCFDADDAAHASPGDTLEISDSIYWNPGCDADVVGAGSLSYSCVYDPNVDDPSRGSTVGAGMIGDNPLFIDLPGHDVRLALGSPCIDTGNAATAASEDYFGTARPQDGDGDTTPAPDMGYFEKPGLALNGLAGDNRYATAVEIAREAFPDMTGEVVIASGQNYPDALSAAGLAGAVDAPLLLTKSTTLPSEVIELMDDWGVAVAYVIGGEAAISGDVFDAIDAHAYHDTIRISGANRYETAAMVAEEIAMWEGDDFSQHAFIARGDSFPDALSASPLAYANASPILLTRTGSLPSATADVLEDLDIESAVVLGGTSAVSDPTKAAIDSKLVANGGSASERWWGADRYKTAVEIAENAVDDHWATWDGVGIATGENYPDALAGGARVGKLGGVVLLTKTNTLPAATSDALEDHADAVLYVDVFGGTVAVSDAVRTAVMDALGW